MVSGVIAKINQEAILVYFIGLTTDGIIEIEYIHTLRNLNLLMIIFGILLIIFSLVKKIVQHKLTGYLTSPFHLWAICFVMISFLYFLHIR